MEANDGNTGDRQPTANSSDGVVTLDDRGACVVLRVSGALDLALAPQLRQLAERAVRLGPEKLIIDLTEVSFLASAGMAELVRAHRHSSKSDLRVVAVGRITLRPLQITRLTDELAIFPTLSAALDEQ
ncbi:STAS domain-containing protein [Amycolatopsis sp. cmx-4-54]|uniref:STAS domain-containing protein n=1 Tax=Amycolatopsis sp. cmx-4-54 TaxID=2790936 RepID=UPI0039785BEE